MTPKDQEPDATPEEPLISETDPIDPDEAAENIKEKGEPFNGNFA